MCGIVGVVGKSIPSQDIVTSATSCLSHRGPDDSGVYYDNAQGIGLGHRRLSIIDTSSAGHQPFESPDGRYVMTYNGEIYNYIELREQLKETYEFQTQTDTEVLLAAYIAWGSACVERFNGMFAFAIWDTHTQTLFCARDRLGIKPLYYSYDEHAETLKLASEIKALLALGVQAQENEGIIFDYLNFGLYDHTEETFFTGIHKLAPGHTLTFSGGAITKKKYWELADIEVDIDITEQDALAQLETLLTDAIRLRFRSDVPVGINLSSGLDSNSLYHYAKKVTEGTPHAFSMCLESEEYNECDLIDQSLPEKEKKQWHTTYLKAVDVLGGAEAMNLVQDQPFGGIPTIAYGSLIQLAKKNNTTVLLEGQGVDEILAGYPYYQLEHAKDEEGGQGGETVALGQDMTKLINQGILSAAFKERYKDRELHFTRPFPTALQNAQYRDIRYAKLPRVLRFNDHVTMHYGRELRVPFLDHRIVEFCFSLPARLKINAGSQKYLLRKLMEDVIPEETNTREKKVFGAIQAEWFLEHFKEEVYTLLDAASFQSRPYWDHDRLREDVDAFYRGEIANSFFIWQCFNLEMWFRQYIDQ